MNKKLISLTIISVIVSGLFFTSCIYEDPEPEIRPVYGFELAPKQLGNVKPVLNEDKTQASATLSQSSDSGIVLYLRDDKVTFGANAVVTYEFTYKVKEWAEGSPAPKFFVRYGDIESEISSWDPSYSDKTNYHDGSGTSGTFSGTIKLANDANAIVFATNGYQWAGSQTDSVDVTVTKLSLFE
jgi:hypothetical protein